MSRRGQGDAISVGHVYFGQRLPVSLVRHDAGFGGPRHRFSPRRVDCATIVPDNDVELGGCSTISADTLTAHGQVRERLYNCPRHGLFRRHPH